MNNQYTYQIYLIYACIMQVYVHAQCASCCHKKRRNVISRSKSHHTNLTAEN